MQFAICRIKTTSIISYLSLDANAWLRLTSKFIGSTWVGTSIPHVNITSTPVPTNADGYPVNADGNILPTDDEGFFIYPAIGPDRSPQSTAYRIVDAGGRPIISSSEHIDQRGSFLPTDRTREAPGQDKELFSDVPEGQLSSEGKTLPTDDAVRDTRPAYGPDGLPLPTDSFGMHTDRFERPTTSEYSGIPFEPSETNKTEYYSYPRIGPDGPLLPTDQFGSVLGLDYLGRPLSTDHFGRPVGQDGGHLPTDSNGAYIYEQVEPSFGERTRFYPVIGPDGQPLPTDDIGKAIDPLGKSVVYDENKQPLGPDGRPLPKDDQGRYVYPAVDIDGSVLPTGWTRKPIYPVIGPDGDLLPTDSIGMHIKKNGKPVPTDEIGRPVGDDGSPLPVDSSGRYISKKFPDEVEKVLPTDENGHIMYPVVDPNGVPLPRDSEGVPYDALGNPIHLRDDGVPIAVDGSPLPTDSEGRFVYPFVAPILQVDKNKKPVYPVVDFDGNLLPTDDSGRVVNFDGMPLSTDHSGRPLSLQGSLLPTDDKGRFVLADKFVTKILPTDQYAHREQPIIMADGSLLPTDNTGAYLDPFGKPIPTNAHNKPIGPGGGELSKDDYGRYLYPVIGADRWMPTSSKATFGAQTLPTDKDGFYSYPAIGPDSTPRAAEPQEGMLATDSGLIILSTDSSGNLIGTDGQLLPTDRMGRPVAKDGSLVPTNEQGLYVLQKKAHVVVGPDGQPLPTDSSGRYVDESGAPITTDESGVPLSRDGETLPLDSRGHYVHSAVELRGVSRTTAMSTLPVHIMIGPDGEPLLGDRFGEPLQSHSSPSPGDSVGTKTGGYSGEAVVGMDGELRSVDAVGTRVGESFAPTNNAGLPVDSDGVILSTSEEGYYIYPAVKPDRTPFFAAARGSTASSAVGADILSRDDDTGMAIGPDKKPVPTDESGRPVDKQSHLLPTDAYGRYVQTDEMAVAYDSLGKPVFEAIDSFGRTLPTDEYGSKLGPDGNPLPTDFYGRPVGANGSPYPTDYSNRYVIHDKKYTRMPPTDEGGRIIYPIVDSDGQLLPTDAAGMYIDIFKRPVPTDEDGLPVGPDGKPLPTNIHGSHIYPAVGSDGRPLPTDVHKRPIYAAVKPDGEMLPTDNMGLAVGLDGLQIPTDHSGKPVGKDGSPLPTNAEGLFVIGDEYRGKFLPTDESGHILYPVVDLDGNFLPTDDYGSYLDAAGNRIRTDEAGKPIGFDGKLLPTDSENRYIYPQSVRDTSYTIVDLNGAPLATDDTGAPVGSDGRPLRIDSKGQPLGHDGSVLPKDLQGRYYLKEYGTTSKILSTDESGAVSREHKLHTTSFLNILPDSQALSTESPVYTAGDHIYIRTEDATKHEISPSTSTRYVCSFSYISLMFLKIRHTQVQTH